MIEFQSTALAAQTSMGSATVSVAAFGVSPNAFLLRACFAPLREKSTSSFGWRQAVASRGKGFPEKNNSSKISLNALKMTENQHKMGRRLYQQHAICATMPPAPRLCVFAFKQSQTNNPLAILQRVQPGGCGRQRVLPASVAKINNPNSARFFHSSPFKAIQSHSTPFKGFSEKNIFTAPSSRPMRDATPYLPPHASCLAPAIIFHPRSGLFCQPLPTIASLCQPLPATPPAPPLSHRSEAKTEVRAGPAAPWHSEGGSVAKIKPKQAKK
jgi:hypothetical protein